MGAVFVRSSGLNPLQLINPFAPAEYGGVGTAAETWSWNPLLSPGQAPLPRAFQDPRTHEAGALSSAGGH